MKAALAELQQELKGVKAQIREIGGPKGDYCKKCGSTDVFWLFNVYRKGDAILVNTKSAGFHNCIIDDFEPVPE